MIKQRLLTGALNPTLIGETGKWLQALGAEYDFSPEDMYRIELCFEELVTNVVNYSDPCYTDQTVELHAVIEMRRVTLTLIDPASPFDPLSLPQPVQATSIDEVQIGGQGVFLVREFSDACSYERRDDKNRLELVFDLAQPLSDPDPRTMGLILAAQIFQGVSHTVIANLTEELPIQDVVGETILMKPGDANIAVRVVLRGRLKVCLGLPGSGEYFPVEAGECVGEMSVIDERPASAYVVAEANTSLLIIDANLFLDKMLALPRVSRNLLSVLSERTRRNDKLTLLHMRKEIEMEQAQRELQYARSIQESLLPGEPLFPHDARLDCVGRMCTAREVGGDFYDIFALDARHIFFVIADVCGKGLPAALFMVRAIAILRAQSGSKDRTTDYVACLMTSLNQQLCAYNDAQQFLTAYCGIIDLETLTLRYVNAGHNAPLIAIGSGTFEYRAEPISPFVGMIDGLSYQVGEIQLDPGSVVLLYTDGVTEAESHDGGMLGEDRLRALLNTAPTRNAAQLVDSVFADVHEFAAGAAQSDDITVLAMRFA